MRETRSSGSVEGVMSNRDPYSDCVSRRIADTNKRLKAAACGKESIRLQSYAEAIESPWLASPSSRRRSRLRALCTCDLEQPVEQPTSPAISLCSYPMTSCIKKSFL